MLKQATGEQPPVTHDPLSSAALGWRRRLPLLPAFILALGITLIPFLATIWYSLHRWNLATTAPRKFIGFSNYVRIAQDPAFREALMVTVSITLLTVLLSLILGLALAVLLNQEFWGRGVVRTLMIAPFLIMPTAAGLLWKNSMLDPLYGFLNLTLEFLGFGRVDWLGQHPLASVVAVSVWLWTPFMLLILLGGLQSQSPEVLEAAQVDGASARRRFQHITLPHLRPFMELGAILGSMFILQTFDVIFMTTGGGPGQATTNLPYLLYLKAFRSFEVGQASALGVLVVALTISIALVGLRFFTSLLSNNSGDAR